MRAAVSGYIFVLNKVFIMSPWFFNVYMNAVMKEMKMSMERRGENGDYLTSWMQMTLFYMASQKKN